jgi:membrane protein required for colicin V production
MIIDFTFIVLMAMACYKGYSKGLIVAVFSLVAFIVGLAAAIKLSAMVAGWLGTQVSVSKQWLPLLSFALVFMLVSLLVRLGARFIEKTVQFAMLGWVNKIGGILFFAVLYTIILSIIIFYAQQVKILDAKAISASKFYSFLQPIAPKVINGIGSVIPIFKDLFEQLQEFFGGFATLKQ